MQCWGGRLGVRGEAAKPGQLLRRAMRVQTKTRTEECVLINSDLVARLVLHSVALHIVADRVVMHSAI